MMARATLSTCLGELRSNNESSFIEFYFSDKDCFKLRANVEKCVVISLCQVSDNLTSLKVFTC